MQAPARRLTNHLVATHLAPIYLIILATGAAGLGISGPAQASLGAAKASVDTDVAHFKARLKATAQGNYTVQELTSDGGMVTREYSNASGTVFAVSWDGPVRPDLQQLFGNYFPRFQADVQANGRRHQAMRVDDIDLIVRTGGHPGHMWGFALLPGDMPQGFSTDVLQ